MKIFFILFFVISCSINRKESISGQNLEHKKDFESLHLNESVETFPSILVNSRILTFKESIEFVGGTLEYQDSNQLAIFRDKTYVINTASDAAYVYQEIWPSHRQIKFTFKEADENCQTYISDQDYPELKTNNNGNSDGSIFLKNGTYLVELRKVGKKKSSNSIKIRDQVVVTCSKKGKRFKCKL